MFIGSWKIDELLTFAANTHDPTTSGESDADSAPTYRVYEDETGTPILTGTMALLDDTNTVGQYSEQITLSAANGFEAGKSYRVRIRAVVGGVAGSTDRTFQVRARTTDDLLPTSSYTAPLSAAQTQQECEDALAVYDGPTHAELTTAIDALNQSASRRVILLTVGQYERPESGNNTYQIEARTYDGDGALVAADSTPTLAATGLTSGNLGANLSVASNPSTGVYRWTYTVSSGATLEQVRFDLSATIGGSASTQPAFTQVADFVAATFTTADRAMLEQINSVTTGTLDDTISSRASQVSVDAIDDFIDTEVAAIKAKTDNLPASPAAVGSAMTLQDGAITTAKIADGAYTEAKFTVPAEAAGQPAGLFGMIRRIAESMPWGNKRNRNRTSGQLSLRNAADTADLVAVTQSTTGSVDTQTRGA
jgi:hypothetical protein